VRRLVVFLQLQQITELRRDRWAIQGYVLAHGDRTTEVVMTAKEAMDLANATGAGERLRRRAARCRFRRACQREPLHEDELGWTWCPDCLTLFDTYGKPVNDVGES
jgi:hypothetical protein